MTDPTIPGRNRRGRRLDPEVAHWAQALETAGYAHRSALDYAGTIRRAEQLLAARNRTLRSATAADVTALGEHWPPTRSSRTRLRSALGAASVILERPDLPFQAVPPPPGVSVRPSRRRPGGAASGTPSDTRRAWWDERLEAIGHPRSKQPGRPAVVLERAERLLAEVLAARRRGAGWLFPARTGRDGAVNPTTVWSWTKKIAAAAGLDSAKIRTHLLRHTMLTEANDRSGDLRTTQEIGRHSRPETTAGYTRVERAKMQTVVAQVSYGRAVRGGREPDPADAIPGFDYRGVIEAIEAENTPAWIDLGVALTAAGWHPKLVHDGLGPSLWWAHPQRDELIATASIDRDGTHSYALDRLEGGESDHWDFTNPAELAATADAVAAGVPVAGSHRYGPWIEQPFIEFLRGDRPDGPPRPDRTPTQLHVLAD